MPDSVRGALTLGWSMLVLLAAGVGAQVGLYPPAVAWAGLAAWVAFILFLVASPLTRERSRRARGLCPKCGYDLTGNVSGVCPECGTPTPSDRGRNGAADDPRSPLTRALERIMSAVLPLVGVVGLLYYGVRLVRHWAQLF